ncbi:SPOR domain-containing protein [Paraliobacillus sp. X-1268]|uniref:SPOR domain-containing protein n=1 Tax=Paraliobacillus sp. X-1268 TaxID=2213193 RepID=UPI000E3BBF5F|nr:SPOR domain-containing protein [Paraliobacillus sp. X-1268]
MDNNNKITVKINNKKQNKQDSKNDSRDYLSDRPTWFEEAASLDKEEIEEVDVFEKNSHLTDDSSSEKIKSKKNNNSVVKAFIFTACGAIGISVILGFIILKMFVEIDDQDNLATNDRISSEATSTNTGAETEVVDGESITLEALQAYVVQVGVFSTKEKATEWQDKIAASGYNAMVWNEGDQLRLFVGITPTEEGAKAIASDMEAKGLEAYARAWSTTERNAAFNPQVIEWLQTFPTLWTDTVQAVNQDSDAEQVEVWTNWLEAAPEGLPESVTAWKDSIQKIATMITEGESRENKQLQLLEVWQLYQNI